jgi:hypothetical protein
MRFFVFAIFVCLLSLRVAATPLPPLARAEVDALLNQLQSSACEFSRNGTWYSAADAKTHLLRKLDYLEGKNLVQTAEQFIELGASKSSMSGQAYQVKCNGSAPVESQRWLMDKLQMLRVKTATDKAATGP